MTLPSGLPEVLCTQQASLIQELEMHLRKGLGSPLSTDSPPRLPASHLLSVVRGVAVTDLGAGTQVLSRVLAGSRGRGLVLPLPRFPGQLSWVGTPMAGEGPSWGPAGHGALVTPGATWFLPPWSPGPSPRWSCAPAVMRTGVRSLGPTSGGSKQTSQLMMLLRNGALAKCGV